MKVACVLIDHFPFRLELQRAPSLGTRPAIVFQEHGSQRIVLDSSPGLRQVQPGMRLQEALACCKEAVPIEADMPRYDRAFTYIIMRLGDWSPDVEAVGLGCAYVGLSGLEETYGTEERLIDALLQAVPHRLEPRLGVSAGKFPAYLAALKAEPGRAYRPPIEAHRFVAPFPVGVLPVPWEIKERLRSFGLDTLGKIASLPLGPLQAQFGSVGVRIWRLAQGQDGAPILPYQPEEEVNASLAFPAPAATVEPLLLAVDHLLRRLFGQPELRGRYARIALLEGLVVGKPAWQRRVVFKEPVGSRARAYAILKGALMDITLPGPLEEVRLRLQSLTGEAGRQESLFQEVRQRERLGEAVATLKASLGWNPIYQVREVEPWSRIPERRRALVTYEP